MNVYSDFSVRAPRPTVVALGCFDGVHRGHSAVLQTAKEIALERNCDAAALSFTEPPRNYFFPGSVSLLTLPDHKAARMEALGLDALWHIPFDRQISRIPAEEFFYDLLLDHLQAKHIVCGFNYTFGAKAEGTVALLERLCQSNGIGLTVLPPITVGQTEVSSSAIRTAITEGRVEDAELSLGHPYSIQAKVIDGQKLARKLGFPTVNQIFPSPLTVPRYGVYASRVSIEGVPTPFWGISNVGTRPTVNGSLLCVETHLFDFEGDLYDKEIEVAFLSFLRDEKKFDSLEELTARVQEDIEKAKKIIANYKSILLKQR